MSVDYQIGQLASSADKIADALFEMAKGLNRCASAIERLGTGNAATQMGAIELLAKETRDGLYTISASIDGLKKE